ncbi:uncharacterized protein LOC141904238 [Tubulanus polymorphus]|uniref:uncharacterized protein LOC141904238 n=1 Tax=Tubulanus polymorphus TaxID=672921 RepID=UPI003DA4CB32
MMGWSGSVVMLSWCPVLLIAILISLTPMRGDKITQYSVIPASAAKKSKSDQWCSFFNNRAPTPQPELKNCTWFRANSCCLQREIDSTFVKVKPLQGASPACLRYLNYLMCYICAPDQNKFYRRERLTVCEPFCDAFYNVCKSAILKGSVIRDLYDNGRKFCESRRFEVGNDKRCFNHQMEDVYNGSARSGYNLSIEIIVISICIALISVDTTPTMTLKQFTKRNNENGRSSSSGRGWGVRGSVAELVFFVIILLSLFSPVHASSINVSDWSKEISRDLTSVSESTMFDDQIQSVYSEAKYFSRFKNASRVIHDIQTKLENFFKGQLKAVDELSEAVKRIHSTELTDHQQSSLKNLPQHVFIDADDSLAFPRGWLQSNDKFRWPVMWNSSSVKIPDDVSRSDPYVINTVNWTSKLDKTFQSNIQINNDIRWQYFGSVTGVSRQYPGREWQNNFIGFKEDFDPRTRPWYVSATSGPKNLVIILDGSFSMSYNNGLSRMKKIASALIETLTKSDLVSVIVSRSFYYKTSGGKVDHDPEVLSCQGHRMLSATSSHRRDLLSRINSIEAKGGSDHLAAFKMAYKLLHKQQKSGCQQQQLMLILFVGDGDDSDGLQRCDPGYHRYDGHSRRRYVPGEVCRYRYKQLLKLVHENHRVIKDDIKVFTFLTNAQNIALLSELACSGGGLFIPVTKHDNDVIKQMSNYFEYLVDSSGILNETMWTSPYLDKSGLGLIVTAFKAVYSDSSQLLGVVGVDATLNTLETIILNYVWGNAYAFMVDEHAEVIVHPLVKSSAQLLDDPVRVNIMSLETVDGKPDDFQYVVEQLTNGKSGTYKITEDAHQPVLVHQSLYWRPVRYTEYYYQPIAGSGGYSIALVLTESDKTYIQPKQPVSFSHSYLDDLDGYLSLTEPFKLVENVTKLEIQYNQPGFPGVKTTMKSSVVKLSYQSFCTPENRTDNIADLHAYINKPSTSNIKQCPHSKLHPEVRADIKLTSTVDSWWINRPAVIQNRTLWTYIGTENGMMRIYPGVKLKDDFNPTRRPWYRQALVSPGRLAVTAVYRDETGSGKIVTLSKSIHKSMALFNPQPQHCTGNSLLVSGCKCDTDDQCESQNCDRSSNRCSAPVSAVVAFDVHYRDLYRRIINLSKTISKSHYCDAVYKCNTANHCQTKCYIMDGVTNLVIDPDFDGISDTSTDKYERFSLAGKQGRLFRILLSIGLIIQHETIDYQAVCSTIANNQRPVQIHTNTDTDDVTLADKEVKYSQDDEQIGPIPRYRSLRSCMKKVIYYTVNRTRLEVIGGRLSGVLDADPCGTSDYHITAIPDTNLYLIVLENYKRKETFFNFNCQIMNSVQKPGSFEMDENICSKQRQSAAAGLTVQSLRNTQCLNMKRLELTCNLISSSQTVYSMNLHSYITFSCSFLTTTLLLLIAFN